MCLRGNDVICTEALQKTNRGLRLHGTRTAINLGSERCNAGLPNKWNQE
jgi:hypothetical protein